MDRLLTALLQRLPDRFLEAVNTVSFNLLNERGLIVWRDTEPRTQWRYFTIRRNTLPTQAGEETAVAPATRDSPLPLSVVPSILLLLLLGWALGKNLGRCSFHPSASPSASPMPTPSSPPAPTRAAPPAPSTPAPLDFSVPSDHESPSPQPLKSKPNTKPTRSKPDAHPSLH